MFSEQIADFIPLKQIPKKAVFAVTAPATTPSPEHLQHGVSYLERLGHTVKVGDTCHNQHYYVAGDDQTRAYELMEFIDDPSVDAIICARGGYGSIRLLKFLDFELIREQRKPLIGFSDITALQWAIYARCGLPTISAGMVATDMARAPINKQFEERFWKFIESGKTEWKLNYSQSIQETLSGLCFTGTVSLATKLMGSSYFPDLDNAILMLEDVDEMTHKIEAYLLQMDLAGVFERSKAILLGYFRKAKNEQYPSVPPLESVFDRVFESYRKPLIKGIPYGHIDEKIPFPVGAPISLSLGPESYLKSTKSIFED